MQKNGGAMIKILSTVFVLVIINSFCNAEMLVLSDEIKNAKEQLKTKNEVINNDEINKKEVKEELKTDNINPQNEKVSTHACSIEDLKTNPEEPACDKVDKKQIIEDFQKK